MAITEEQIKKAKAKHGDEIYLVSVDGDKPKEKLDFLLRPADRKTMAAAAQVGKSNEIKGAEVMLTNCLIAGDKDALKIDKVFFAVISHLEEINEPRKSTLKKV